MESRLRPLLLVAALALAGLSVTGLAGCASTTKHCSTVGACSTAGAKQFGQPVLTPRGATFVEGSIKNGVLTIEFRDPLNGPAYKEFVGIPKTTPHCPPTIITVSPTRKFCYGSTTTGLVAQLTVGKLVYAMLFAAPPVDAASDRAAITRIMSSLS